jgi:hypothetical protein
MDQHPMKFTGVYVLAAIVVGLLLAPTLMEFRACTQVRPFWRCAID